MSEIFHVLFNACWKSKEDKKVPFVDNTILATYHLNQALKQKKDLTYGNGAIPKGRLIDLASATILIFDAVHRIDPEIDFARVIKTKLDSDKRNLK